jgi:phage baseplate assembly protein gpV
MTDMRALVSAGTGRIGKSVFGIISAVDPVRYAIKALVQPDNVETGWMQFGAVQAGDVRICAPPSIGTHVVLAPMEGDQENLTVSKVLFDAVVTPPTSPATGAPAQPGELLIMAGCGAPPESPTGTAADPATANAPWWHLTASTLYSGAGNATQTLTNGSQIWVVGGCTATLSASGFVVTGGTIRSDTDVIADTISGKTHEHTNGNDGGNTGEPIA